jgi:hypothetical protein
MGMEDPAQRTTPTSNGRTAVKNTVNITEATKFVGKKDDFLSNESNKKSLIDILCA